MGRSFRFALAWLTLGAATSSLACSAGEDVQAIDPGQPDPEADGGPPRPPPPADGSADVTAPPVADAGSDASPDGGGADAGKPKAPGFMLPFACNKTTTVTQGNNSPYSHNGKSAYAFDFGVGLNTPLHASNDGTVIFVRNDVKQGNPCYSGGGSGCANTVNYVVVDHGDKTATIYLHINEAKVTVGQKVARGDLVALSGSTGWSTGPHLHLQRQQTCGIWYCQSVPLAFLDVPFKSGVPASGDSVTSKNGCL